jgi:hypothetical protein
MFVGAMNRVVVAVLVVLVIGLSIAGFFLLSSTPSSSSNGSIQTATSLITTSEENTVTQPNIISLKLFLSDYGFNASRGGPTIRAFVGDIIRITLIGNGTGPIRHDFTLDSGSPSPYDVRSERLSRGQQQVLEFIAAYEGEYKYYCSVRAFTGPSHRERGQEGPTGHILTRINIFQPSFAGDGCGAMG